MTRRQNKLITKTDRQNHDENMQSGRGILKLHLKAYTFVGDSNLDPNYVLMIPSIWPKYANTWCRPCIVVSKTGRPLLTTKFNYRHDIIGATTLGADPSELLRRSNYYWSLQLFGPSSSLLESA